VSISDALLLPFSDALSRRLVLDREAPPTRGKSRLGNVALAFKSLSISGLHFLLAVGDLLKRLLRRRLVTLREATSRLAQPLLAFG
jgi:hypothetical protein